MRAATGDVKAVNNGVEGGAAGQPYLHELATAVQAPGVVLSAGDGQIRSGAHGAFWADRRLLSALIVRVDGVEPVGIGASSPAPGQLRFIAVVRQLGDDGADPTVTVQRDRRVVDGGLLETITLASSAHEPVTALLELDVACDLAEMAAVKSGRSAAPLPPDGRSSGLQWDGPEGHVVRLHAEPPPTTMHTATLSWTVEVARGARFSITVGVGVHGGPPPVVVAAPVAKSAGGAAVRCDDHRLSALVAQSRADLDSLRLADPLDSSDHFLAAGAPWFLTLFGRDAIWAARMVLPLGTDLAGGTLRALARRQGTVVDVATGQEPGKIMHEIRSAATTHDRFRLPPLYYGTVDATALWISLLHDAWRWGLPSNEVAALLPAAERAMDWIVQYGTAASGFVSYRDESGAGLANQGWKDSGDAVQFRDGTMPTAPIALCEVQGYAHAAARHAADLFDAFGRPGGDALRGWADDLNARFRGAFWVDDADGAYPAIALDVGGTCVDTVTSNIAHLLGTGLLDAAEERRVVARLARGDMDCGHGLRTMSSASAGYNPLAYHAGSVWTHDTAIAIAGLATSASPGAADVAASLTCGLLAAAPSFDFRLPELFGGHDSDAFPNAVPYPAACRPQAWSAAASIAIVAAVIGVRADVPSGIVHLRPMRPSPVGALSISGMRFADASFDVAVDAAGDPSVRGLPDGVRVIVS